MVQARYARLRLRKAKSSSTTLVRVEVSNFRLKAINPSGPQGEKIRMMDKLRFDGGVDELGWFKMLSMSLTLYSRTGATIPHRSAWP